MLPHDPLGTHSTAGEGELKSNFLRTARAGDGLLCRASSTHAGRTAQVWDAEVRRESDGQAVALFRCTRLVLAGRRA